MPVDGFGLVALCAAGLGAGLWLLVRGMGGFRQAARIGDTATSPIASAAAGEVRVCGIVEPAELVLTSPLQSIRCIYYRAAVEDIGGDRGGPLFEDERAVGFRVRDASGSVRVFPRGAAFDVPLRYDDRSGSVGERPPGLHPRDGDAVTVAREDRETQVARLLTVQRPSNIEDWLADEPAGRLSRGRRRYREARLEPGETVTVVGHLLPFADLPDPVGASDVAAALDPLAALADPEIAADLAEARSAGLLETDPREAWGNAAIPGFGIGRPVRAPELDPAARPPEPASSGAMARNEAAFEIAPEELVLAATPDWPLLIAAGAPGDAVERHESRFLVGLLGAALAIGSAVVLALALSGALSG